MSLRGLCLFLLSALLPLPFMSAARQYGYQYPATQYPIQAQPPPPHPMPLQVEPYAAASNWKYIEQRQSAPQPLQAQQAQQPQQQPASQLPAKQPTQGPLSYEEWTRAVDAIISKGVLKLSLSLAEAVERDGDLAGQVSNVVFSPVNVASALALVLAGSNGTTFSEIARVLGIAAGVNLLDNREHVHKEFGRFLSQLESQSTIVKANNVTGGNHVVFANGLFVQQEYDVHPAFADIALGYRSQVIPVDFGREPGRTKERINSWFSEHTMGRIKSVLADAPPTDTRLMIASALFFNGVWESPFPLEATMTRPFYGVGTNGSREAAAVRMMTNNLDLPFAADRALGCRLLELPYRGRDVSMFLVLPDVDGLAALRELERRLSSDALEQLLASRKEAPVIYSVPRMKLQRSVSLRTALETLGVRTLFDENLADLTHISSSVLERAPVPASPEQGVPPPAAAAPALGSAPAAAAKPAATAVPPAPSPGTTPVPSASANRKPLPTTRRPAAQGVGENSIAPDSQFYFASRMSSLAQGLGDVDKGNNTMQTDVGDRWNAPQRYPPARLFADDVLHKVEVEVTETGTVASAATAITISRDGSNHVMRFNRPFIFFIRHNPTGLLLFYGAVVRPMPEWIVPGVDVSQLPPARPPGSSGHRQPSQQQGSRRPPSRQRQQQPAAPVTARTNG